MAISSERVGLSFLFLSCQQSRVEIVPQAEDQERGKVKPGSEVLMHKLIFPSTWSAFSCILSIHMSCPDPVSPGLRTCCCAMNQCEHLRRKSKLSFWPPTSLFTPPKAPTTTGRFKPTFLLLLFREIVALLLALGCCCWCPSS